MKNFAYISAILLSLQFVNAQAAVSYKCLDFIAPVSPSVNLGLVPDDLACDIVREAKAKYYPDITLLIDTTTPPPFPPDGFPLCFTSNFTGSLGGTNVIVTTHSGITETYLAEYTLSNSLYELTAATAFTINKLNNDGTSGRELGTFYTQDEFLDMGGLAPREYQTVVGGRGQFDQAKGHFVIEGDAMALGTQVKGKLCIQNN